VASTATPLITVCPADRGGWHVRLTIDARVITSDYYTDWHRVERRKAMLEAQLATSRRPAATVTALIVALALLPGSLLAQAAQEATPGLPAEPRLLRRAMTVIGQMKTDDGRSSEGFYIETGQMITGAGWISGGPGYRVRLFGEAVQVDASAAVSWRLYKAAQLRVEIPTLVRGRLTAGGQVLWRDMTQVSYFGTGPQSLESRRSDYRIQASNVIGYAGVRPRGPWSLTGAAGWLSRPSLSSSTGPFDRDVPDTTREFADDGAVSAGRQPGFFHGELSLVYDTRNHPGHSTAGGLYRGAWARYRDRHDATYSFGRYELEGARFVPLASGRLVIAMHGLGVFSTSKASRSIPFYLLPSLGGNNTLRGYADYRFHDRHLIAANLESRFPLLTHVDGALFFDAGNVAGKVTELSLAHTSYGAGLRLHTGTSTVARLDVARSHEGWRLNFRLSDSLRLARVSRRHAAIPFVP
jgi:hypothetical protein